MISVDNSAEKRVFHLTKYEKKANFIQLKNEIIKNIEDKNYFNLAKLIKRLQDIMRGDAGVGGDEQRLSQIVWILFFEVVFLDKGLCIYLVNTNFHFH